MIINDYTPSEDIFRNMLIELINKRKITIEALDVNALLGCHDLVLSCCHEIARISVMECSL